MNVLIKLPRYALALPAVLVIRLIRPWYLVRLGVLIGNRLGHFAANTEMYLCERDAGINVPKRKYIDLFYVYQPVCNTQLAVMWQRVLIVFPTWLMAPIIRINRLLPGWAIHEVGTNTQSERDVHNLLDRFPPHLTFTKAEKAKGQAQLIEMGIPEGSRIVCLIVRDNAYLNSHQPGDWAYHDFRNSDIQNYVLMANELASRGYFVVRMGVKVREPIKSTHPRVIDYATNGMRNDFMDIYLGAECEFCVATGTGWDAVPAWLFRKPTVYVNYLEVGMISSYTDRFIFITKHHRRKRDGENLTLSEIFKLGIGFSMNTSILHSEGVELVDNSSDEILAATIEMVERLNGTWILGEDDLELQERFLRVFPTTALDLHQSRPLHGEFRARIGAAFLRENRNWLQ